MSRTISVLMTLAVLLGSAGEGWSADLHETFRPMKEISNEITYFKGGIFLELTNKKLIKLLK